MVFPFDILIPDTVGITKVTLPSFSRRELLHYPTWHAPQSEGAEDRADGVNGADGKGGEGGEGGADAGGAVLASGTFSRCSPARSRRQVVGGHRDRSVCSEVFLF